MAGAGAGEVGRDGPSRRPPQVSAVDCSEVLMYWRRASKTISKAGGSQEKGAPFSVGREISKGPCR